MCDCSPLDASILAGDRQILSAGVERALVGGMRPDVDRQAFGDHPDVPQPHHPVRVHRSNGVPLETNVESFSIERYEWDRTVSLRGLPQSRMAVPVSVRMEGY
jgi:hypothetical protein